METLVLYVFVLQRALSLTFHLSTLMPSGENLSKLFTAYLQLFDWSSSSSVFFSRSSFLFHHLFPFFFLFLDDRTYHFQAEDDQDCQM